MKSCNLVLEVHLHEERFHGEPEWPPAPGRVFQALVAAAAEGSEVPHESAAALRWLEVQEPPTIGAPHHRVGQAVAVYVPNNDLDSKDADPRQVEKIRVAKRIQPRLLERRTPFIYAWNLEDGELDDETFTTLSAVVERLYQLGRGIDMAWGTLRLLSGSDLEDRWSTFAGDVYRPSPFAVGESLPCPTAGSYDSLVRRYEASLARFSREKQGKKHVVGFNQPPKAMFRPIAYDAGPARQVFEVRTANNTSFAPVPLREVSLLVMRLRDAAATRLNEALPERADDVERGLVGRRVEGRPRIPSSARIRLVPLPSIGHIHADRLVRRLLVEVPPENPLRADDVFWAFSGLALPEEAAGESAILSRAVAEAGARPMLEHYNGPARCFRTVTPVALNASAHRRRIEPTRQQEEAKGPEERLREESAAAHLVRQAIRHAGVTPRPTRICVQREPFERRGVLAEEFSVEARFNKHGLWHVEVEFPRAITGPLVLGDGRFVGLGVMAPTRLSLPGWAWRITAGLAENADPFVLTKALRRAVMARYQQAHPKARLPTAITGHGPDGSPAEGHPHLTFAFEPETNTLMAVVPTQAARERHRWVAQLDDALVGFCCLRAGAAGRLELSPTGIDLQRHASTWRSTAPYAVERHRKLDSADAAVAEDLREACLRRGLPDPKVTVGRVMSRNGRGLEADVVLEFSRTVRGPISLGRTRHRGGGWFVPATK